jgi:hypothetical protein
LNVIIFSERRRIRLAGPKARLVLQVTITAGIIIGPKGARNALLPGSVGR